MSEIRFPGMWVSAGQKGTDGLRKLTGLNLIPQGDDLIIPDGDPSLTIKPEPLFKIGKFHELKEESFPAVADQYISFLVKSYEEYEGEQPKNVPVHAVLGLIAEIKEIIVNFFFCNQGELRELIIQKVCGFMKAKFNCLRVVPVNVNATRQQALLSLAKITLLVDKLGLDKAREVNFESNSLERLLPHPAHMLSYAEALLFCAPVAIALPINRVGSTLYFLPNGPILLAPDANAGFFETISSSLDPLVDEVGYNLITLHDLKPSQQKRYFLLVITGLNRLMNYLNNYCNYQNDDGTVDFARYLQAHSALHLIFAELLSMNYSNSRYLKQKLVFSILNKVANLKKFVGGGTKDETKLFRSLFSSDVRDTIVSILKYHGRLLDRDLGNNLSSTVYDTYKKMFSFVSERIDSHDEDLIGEYFATIRNANEHGTFLRGGQFERIFINTDGALPIELTRLPFLMVLAMTLEPSRFLDV